MRLCALMALLLLGGARSAPAAELKPATVAAFDHYVQQREQTLRERGTFLWADQSAQRRDRVHKGDIVVEPTLGDPIKEITDGLVHDWVGSVFVPGVTLPETLEHIQDYNNERTRHQDVLESHIIWHRDDEFMVFMRLVKKKIITVVLDTEHDIHYYPIDATHCRSESRTVKIAEVENPGKRDERELPPGTGHGFLWKLDTFWRFEQRDGGTWIECEAISLTRDIPTGLGWLVEPIIRSLPHDSLENTLRETAKALRNK